jgi:hypothetical protein
VRAIKLQGYIDSNHTMHLQLPADLAEGPAEVIVLVAERDVQRQSRPGSLQEFLQQLKEADIPRRSKEEIDRYVEEERASWERDDDPRDLPRELYCHLSHRRV